MSAATSPSAGSLEDRIAAAWASLLDRSDAIADDLALRLIENDRHWYDRAGPSLRAEVRSSTREHVRRGLRALAGAEDPAARAVVLWRDTGQRRARQGVPLELVLNAYALGSRIMWEALLERGRDGSLGDDHVLMMAGQRIWKALDRQNAELVESYRREGARMQRRDLQRQQGYLDGLVDGRGADPEFASGARHALGLDVDDAVACVVGPLDDDLEQPLRAAPQERLERAGHDSHWHVRAGTYFGLVRLGTSGVDDLVAVVGPATKGRVGVARSRGGVAGFANAYQLAARAAETVPRGRRDAVSVTDRLPEVLLNASPEVAALLVEETLAPVLAQPEHQSDLLLETLRALLAHQGSPTHAAADLFCHRNTVIYRARQLREITGRDLQDPRDRLLLSLALVALGRWTPDG